MSRSCSLAWFLAVLLLLGCTGASSPQGSPKAAASSEQRTSTLGALAPGEPNVPIPVEADDARLGTGDAEVTLIAFLDYECRYCKEAFGALLELRRKYAPETLRIVIKHLPLDDHPMAVPAAIAGQAVSDEAGADAFMEFSQLVFEHQGELSYVTLAEWATQVGVARSVYNEAVSSEATLERVANDARLAWRRGAEGTPTLFVNGRLVETVPSTANLSPLIDEELALMRAGSGSWQTRYAARVTKNAGVSLTAALLADDSLDYRVPVAGSAVHGSPQSLVTLVVFTDYQCPYCKRADATLRDLLARHPSDLRLVFKHLPLPFHAAARPAARLAEAVRQKGGDQAFFAVSAELFEQSPKLGTDVLTQLGKRHGLDESSILLAISGGDRRIEAKIDRDLELADDVQAAGTPHVFINGKRLAGARPLEHFEAVVLSEKERAKQRLGKGVSPSAVYDDLQSAAVQPGAPKAIQEPPVLPENPTRGPDGAAVTIHVFSDFECPYCRQAELTVLELERLYQGQLRIVWHDRPLDFHPLAMPAARAGQEARKQGGNAAFWRLHALMFGLEGASAEISRAQLLAHAQTLGLDRAAMEKAIDTNGHDLAIERDVELATKLGFRGTPAFIVGGYELTGARNIRHFRRLIELSLARARASAP